jgi:hypothetical protein
VGFNRRNDRCFRRIRSPPRQTSPCCGGPVAIALNHLSPGRTRCRHNPPVRFGGLALHAAFFRPYRSLKDRASESSSSCRLPTDATSHRNCSPSSPAKRTLVIRHGGYGNFALCSAGTSAHANGRLESERRQSTSSCRGNRGQAEGPHQLVLDYERDRKRRKRVTAPNSPNSPNSMRS